MILGICSMLVPIPCEMSPPTPFSRKDVTAKPTMWQAHPTAAAPPASSMAFTSAVPAVPPERMGEATATQIAALEVGIVSRMPMTTEITIPMTKGVMPVAAAINAPSWLISQIKGKET